MDPEYLSTQVLKALLWTCPLIRRAAMFTRLILSGGDKIHSQEVHFELLWSFLSPKNYVNDVFIASDEVHHLCVKIYSQFYIYVVIQSQKITTLFCCVHQRYCIECHVIVFDYFSSMLFCILLNSQFSFYEQNNKTTPSPFFEQ